MTDQLIKTVEGKAIYLDAESGKFYFTEKDPSSFTGRLKVRRFPSLAQASESIVMNEHLVFEPSSFPLVCATCGRSGPWTYSIQGEPVPDGIDTLFLVRGVYCLACARSLELVDDDRKEGES
jgi:hypothetical protein